MNYYNENDPGAAQWLRNLIVAGLIAPGEVDDRSIVDVQPSDLRGFVQCHFFAGIGGWSYALRLANWPDERPVWTGSCPCQPFSVAGRGKGVKDERHLWPEFQRLIAECGPSVVFGEQVASKAGRRWLARVRAEMEALGYGVGAADLCAAGIAAPHIRQRLWWVGDAGCKRDERRRVAGVVAGARKLAEEQNVGEGRRHDALRERERRGDAAGDHGADSGVGNADDARPQRRSALPERAGERSPWEASLESWIPCADGKARRIKPGLEPLAHGIPARVVRLRAYGNAIVPQVAEVFIRAYVDAC